MKLNDSAYVVPYAWTTKIKEALGEDNQRSDYMDALFYLSEMLNLWRKQGYKDCVHIQKKYFKETHRHHHRKVIRVFDILERAGFISRNQDDRMAISLNLEKIPHSDWWYDEEDNS